MMSKFFLSEEKDKKINQLSGGNFKKVELACTLIGRPNVVIIDEPILGLDINFQIVLKKILF